MHNDQSRAWRKTFPNSKGKPENVHTKASLMHGRANVQQRINELRLKKAQIAQESFDIDAYYVLKRLYEIDRLDILDIITDDLSAFKPLSNWPETWRRSISSMDLKRVISNDNIETIIDKIKWPDKLRNLELIGKHININAFVKDDSIKNQEPIQIEFINAVVDDADSANNTAE